MAFKITRLAGCSYQIPQICRVQITGPLWGKSTSLWIHLSKGQWHGPSKFSCSFPEQTVVLPVIWDVMMLMQHLCNEVLVSQQRICSPENHGYLDTTRLLQNNLARKNATHNWFLFSNSTNIPVNSGISLGPWKNLKIFLTNSCLIFESTWIFFCSKFTTWSESLKLHPYFKIHVISFFIGYSMLQKNLSIAYTA